MSTYIKISDEVSGPFTDKEIREKFETGQISPDTPAWRMGMPEWRTIAAMFPDECHATPLASSPPSMGNTQPMVDSCNLEEALNTVNAAFDPPRDESFLPQSDVLERLQALAQTFLNPLQNRLGQTARPDPLGFYSYRVVTAGIQRLRLDLLKGARLTAKGEQFVASAAAFLGCIAAHNWQRRGLHVFGHVHFEPGDSNSEILIAAERIRENHHETYAHDFLADMFELLLKPPRAFPSLHGRAYMLTSLTLPAPEQLYLYGICLMNSDSARGTWPKTQQVGGLNEDFQVSKQLLIDDLHRDCGLPLQDEALRQLSLWVVFPPYGWDMNDANDYNFMTIFDQITLKHVVPLATGIEYLQALLRCQSLDIRNLAARCLMVYRIPPRDWQEACHYQQAMASTDYDLACSSMAKFQSKIEAVENTAAWQEEIRREREKWITPSVTRPWQCAPVFSDPDYLALSQSPPERAEDGLQVLESLLQKYPADFSLRTIHASLLMKGPDPQRGEFALRELTDHPLHECSDAHLRLGTLLKHQNRRGEAMEVFEDAVAHWPWHHQAVDSCLWLVTDGMTEFPNPAAQAA